MKKYLFMLMMLVTSFGFSQGLTDSLVSNADSVSQDYPKPYIVGEDTVGMIISIEQAQKIDNDYELLKMYEDLAFSYEQGDTVYLSVIGKLEEQVSVMEIEINTLKSVNQDKDSVITKLNQQIELYEKNEDNFEKELANKDLIIAEKDKQIKKHKRQKLWGGIGGGVAIIGLITLLILK